MPSKTFKDLIVWKKAHEWVLEIYHFTDSFPKKEQFGLTSQLRRAATSIPANIAEGFKKGETRIRLAFITSLKALLRNAVIT